MANFNATYERATFDSQHHSVYGDKNNCAVYTFGYIYRFTLNETIYGFAVLDTIGLDEETTIIGNSEFDRFMEDAKFHITEKFADCELKKWHPKAQKMLLETIGEDAFPFKHSIWASKKQFEEYFQPKTFEGVMAYINRHERFYGRNPIGHGGNFESVFFKNVVMKKEISFTGNNYDYTCVTIIRNIDNQFFEITENYYWNNEDVYRLNKEIDCFED
jgi:hypothetical protein